MRHCKGWGGNRSGARERCGPMKGPGSEHVPGRQDEIWCVLEVGGRARPTVPSLCSVIPRVVSPV